MTPKEVRDLGRKAGYEGKSAKDNPLLGGPNYLADAWWLGCAEAQKERVSPMKPQDLEKAVRAICRERAAPACDCRAKDLPCQAPLENLLHETNPMRYQAIAVVDALIRDPNGRVAALERLAAAMSVLDKNLTSVAAWSCVSAALAEVDTTK
jgi:hypothetical protein